MRIDDEQEPDCGAIDLTSEETQILSSWLLAPETPKTVARRATIIREAARGRSNSEIARSLAVSRGTVIRWRRRFRREGILSLSEVRPGRGRRRSVSNGTVLAIVRAARVGAGPSARQPSCRSLAERSGVSAATVFRVWDAHGVRRNGNGHEALALVDVPDAARLISLAGVFLDPPDRALVFRCGERAGGDEPAPTVSRALVRACDHFDRAVVGDFLPRDRERAFLKLLRQIERASVPGSSLLLVLDAEGGTHRRASVRRWLQARPHLEVRMIADAGSTAALLSRAIAAPRRAALPSAFQSLLDDLCGYLSLYEGEPDRFVWIAPPGADVDRE